ncbi:MAG: gamma-glutamyl-gamma-aminobutyrate hydrolase family protein, partial [Planctomycetota bacterium]|nr:gamma-glutamyl-gamma-aminobutyrate hydrolase family protein [Planctomycetota bacterium]
MPEPLHVLFVDHLDSFSYNLVEAFERRDAVVRVYRASLGAERLLAESAALPGPALAVLSPGPGKPGDVPETLEFIRRLPDDIPLFGVCLGMQAMVEAYGGKTGRASERLHGQASSIEHDGRGPFRGLASPMIVGRYHSLCATEVVSPLEVTATDGALPMAVRH